MQSELCFQITLLHRQGHMLEKLRENVNILPKKNIDTSLPCQFEKRKNNVNKCVVYDTETSKRHTICDRKFTKMIHWQNLLACDLY